MPRTVLFTTALLSLLSPLMAVNANRDFSGAWRLDRPSSAFRDLGNVDESLTITQNEVAIECTAGRSHWIIPLDGSESKYLVGAEKWTSASKWEGSALLINTLVSGPQDYTIMDRWQLSRDHAVLTIGRQLMRGRAQSEGQIVYRRQTAASADPQPQTLGRRPEPAAAAQREYVVPAGTRVLLELVNTVDTKHSREGDPVYLQTAFPVVIEQRTVIPRGSNVIGAVGSAKRPGRVAGKGELYIRFEQLTLPNGVTRDFRSRIGSADNGSGQLDRKEGTIRGEGDKTGDARTVATGTGIGATIGGVAGRSMGATGVGAAAGAAAGLAGVLIKRGPDPSLPRGTQVEMVLDRDLHYRADELPAR